MHGQHAHIRPISQQTRNILQSRLPPEVTSHRLRHHQIILAKSRICHRIRQRSIQQLFHPSERQRKRIHQNHFQSPSKKKCTTLLFYLSEKHNSLYFYFVSRTFTTVVSCLYCRLKPSTDSCLPAANSAAFLSENVPSITLPHLHAISA